MESHSHIADKHVAVAVAVAVAVGETKGLAETQCRTPHCALRGLEACRQAH